MSIESLFLVLIGVLLLAAGVSSLDSVLRFGNQTLLTKERCWLPRSERR